MCHSTVLPSRGAWRGEENWQVKDKYVSSQQDPPGWQKKKKMAFPVQLSGSFLGGRGDLQLFFG